MNIYQQGFREDILNTIFKLGTKTWLKITGAYAIQYVATMLVALAMIIPMFASFFSIDELAGLQNNPQAILDFSEKIETAITSSPSIIPGLIAFMIIVMFFYSWGMNIQLNIADTQIKKAKVDFGDTLKKSFNTDVLRILLAIALIYLLSVAMYAIAAFAVSLSGFLAFLLFLLVTVIALRFFLVVPALIIGRQTLSEAFAWSLQKINWVRSIKLLGIGFLAVIILAVIGLIIGLVSMIFVLIPFLGVVVQWGINIFFGGFTAALMTATMIGLYYRYANDIPDNPGGNLE